MSIVVVKLLLSVASLLLAGLVWYKRDQVTARLSQYTTVNVLLGGWILTRLLPFGLLYLVLDYAPTSDVKGFWDEASKASQGQMVYRDFWSPYSPFYPYFLGVWLWLWYSPKMIVLVMCVMDGIILWLSNRFYEPLLDRSQRLFRSLMYLLLPGTWMLCVIGAQEDVWMWGFVVAAYLLYMARQQSLLVYGGLLALGLLTTKAIFVLILIPLVLLHPHRFRLIAIMAAVGLPVLGWVYLYAGMEFLQPLDEAKVLRAPNLLSVLNPWFFNKIGVGESFWNWIGLVVSLGVGGTAVWQLRNAPFQVMLSQSWICLYATMMIVQQSAYSNYIFLFSLPLVLYGINWQSSKQVGLLFLFNFVSVVHPSYWWRLGMPKYHSPAELWATTDALLDYLLQLAVVITTLLMIKLHFPKNSPQPIH